MFGQFRDADGQPVAQAKVVVSFSTDGKIFAKLEEGVTDANGRYRIAYKLPARKISLLVEACKGDLKASALRADPHAEECVDLAAVSA